MDRLAGGTVCVIGIGLISSVGNSNETSCAAMRAKLTNPTETRFVNLQGEWILAHEVKLEQAWRGVEKLARMAFMAIAECLDTVPMECLERIPLILCIAEPERPGRWPDLEQQLLAKLQSLLHCRFSAQSIVIARGRAGIGIALHRARQLLHQGDVQHVLVAATDSLITSAVLESYEDDDRLLTPRNSNGLIVGEGGGALLLTLKESLPALRLTGLGFGMEQVHVNTDLPLRADGLTHAIRAALGEANRMLHELDFRIADLAGEHYQFKEAALALGRLLHTHKESFELWHPAECIGETGALAGLAAIALADAACRKGYCPGPRILIHAGSDSGQRVAAVFEYGGEA